MWNHLQIMFIGSHYDYTFIIIYKFDEVFLDDCDHDDHNDVEERVSWLRKKLNEKYIDMEQCKSNQCYNKILFSFRSFKNLSFFWNQRIIAVFCLFLVYTLQNLTFRPSFIYAYYDGGEHFFQLTFLFEIIFTAH